jgi:hypothetical protein
MRLKPLLSIQRWLDFVFRPTAYRNGHFYSPAVDATAMKAKKSELWPDSPPETPGISWDLDGHRRLLADWQPIAADWDYADRPAGTGFREPNGSFEGLDSRVLYAMLRSLKPQRLVEVGSGMSSLLIADVNTRHLDNAMAYTAIEPFPKDYLRRPVQGLTELRVEEVQNVPLEVFQTLAAGDILFIDSSHVAKTGSDVNYLYLQVLPRLASGVYLHIHDIFLPWDYPYEWVVRERRNWNEQYLLQALLTGSRRLQIRFANHFAQRMLPEAVEQCWGDRLGGGSIWLTVE